MAKRSDFAHKLLDDLRLRKERMAAAQSSKHSKTTAIDAYAYSKQTYRGLRETKTRTTAGSRTGNAHNRPMGGNKVIAIGEASKHIVPFGKGQSSAQAGNLSMALAFALENMHKLRLTDSSGNNSMLNFLQQIGKGSVEFGRLERRSAGDRLQTSAGRFPTFSHLHIKEISKGAQKLNQILNACSNDHNFNKYSVEIGKELLKGAIDLEESLRRLVNMQEASEYTVSSQRKSRITLLEEDDDIDKDVVITNKQKQLDLPRFSFDKPSRNSHTTQEVARSSVMQRATASSYPKGASNSNHERQTLITSNSVSHVCRASYGSDVKTLEPFTGQKDHTNSIKPEKGRIPSVIVKLMGLDELPEIVDPKYIIQKKMSSARDAEKKSRDTHNLPQQSVKQKVMQPYKSPILEDTTVVVQTEKNTASGYSNIELVLHDGKQLRKDLEGTKSDPSSTETRVKIKQHGNIAFLNPDIVRQNDVREKERKHDSTKQKKLKDIGKSKSKEIVIKDELQQIAAQKQKRRGAAAIMREKTEREASRLHIQNKQKPQSHLGIQQPSLLNKVEPQEEKNLVEEKEQWRAKQKIQVRKQKENEMMSKISSKSNHDAIKMQKKKQYMNLVKPILKCPREPIDPMSSKWFQDKRHHDDFDRKGSSIQLIVSMKGSMKRNSDDNSSMTHLESEADGAPPFIKEKVVHVPVSRKVKYEEMHNRNGSLNGTTGTLKQQSASARERKHEISGGSREAETLRGRRIKEAEAHMTKSNESDASIQATNLAQQLHKENGQTSILYGPREDECLSAREPQTVAPSGSSQRITPIAVKGKKDQAHFLGGETHKFDEIISITGNRTQGGKDISYPAELQPKEIFKPAIQNQLTEREKHLKHILMKSQIFLDTAEALLKLNLSFVILNAGGHDCLDEDEKLLLDCGYEIMMRKGTRQEISIYPYVKISITSKRIVSLDDLVKQLDEDFEVLKLYGKNGQENCKPEDYLPKMLESDVHDRYPDMNCMWDGSWDTNMLAFLEEVDVIKEVERHVLNRLVSEICLDFLHK